MLEIVTDVLHNFLLCGSRKTRYRNRTLTSFLSLIFTDKLPYIEVVDSEILTPRRKTMRFIYHKSHHMT